jgi:hypothetical protein
MTTTRRSKWSLASKAIIQVTRHPSFQLTVIVMLFTIAKEANPNLIKKRGKRIASQQSFLKKRVKTRPSMVLLRITIQNLRVKRTRACSLQTKA